MMCDMMFITSLEVTPASDALSINRVNQTEFFLFFCLYNITKTSTFQYFPWPKHPGVHGRGRKSVAKTSFYHPKNEPLEATILWEILA